MSIPPQTMYLDPARSARGAFLECVSAASRRLPLSREMSMRPLPVPESLKFMGGRGRAGATVR